MKKRTLVILYWDLGIGGIQKRIRDLVIELSNHHRDWVVYILLRRKAKDGFDSQIKTGHQVVIQYFPYSGSRKMRVRFLLWVSWQIFRLKPHVLLTFQHVLSSVAVTLKLLLWMTPMKVVLNESFLTSYNLTLHRTPLIPSLVGFMYSRADTIIVPTRACSYDLVHHFSIPATKIVIVPNWTCLSPQHSLQITFDYLFVGRFEREKRPLSIVQVTKIVKRRHSDVRVGMMGSGDLSRDLQEAIAAAHLSKTIRLVPFSQEVADTLRRAKLLIVPSAAEGMPNVVLEAAMCGIPSVVNGFPGADEVVQHKKTGYIGKTDQEMADYVDYLLEHEQVRKHMGLSAQRHVLRAFAHNTQRRFIEELLSK